MADVAASVLARLKNKAAESGRSYQLCLQLFCQEEFLRRLEKSKYAENLVLKGGLFLYSLTDFDSRVTADVDFLLRKMPNTPEQLQAILEGIIATQTGNDFITFEIKNVAPIAVAKKYAGIGASLVARIKNTKTPFGIDFGVGDHRPALTGLGCAALCLAVFGSDGFMLPAMALIIVCFLVSSKSQKKEEPAL